MSGFSFRPRGPERAPRNQLGSPVPGATPALRHPGHMAELSISVPAAAAVPLQGAASPCRPPPPAHGWTPLLHGLTFSGHMSPRMTSSVTVERSPVTPGGRLAGHPSSDRSLASPAGRHAPPTADGSQSPAPADGAGRSLSAAARSPPAVRRQSHGAEKPDVVLRTRAESDAKLHGDRGATVRTEKSVLPSGVTPDAVRGSPNVCSERVSSGVSANGGPPPPRPLFRPYCDNVVSRTRDGATVQPKRNERETDEKCGERRSKSPQRSAKGAAVGGEAAPASAISGETDEPGAEGDISGAGGELPDCCRTRPLSQTWVRYSEWCRRRRRRRSAAASSDVIGDVTPDQMISISGLGPFAAPGPGPGPGAELASPGAGEAGRPVAVSSAPRTVLPATASGGKLVGIAKARQREPECAAQPTVLTSIAGRLSLPGFGGPVWTGAAPGRDLTGAAWGVPGSPAPQPAPLPPMWLGPTPQPYAATQLYTSYQVQLHSDPATGHLMLVPRSVEPAPRPTVLWSPYQCVSPLQSPQLTVLPSQPPQLYIQATSEQTLLTSTGAQVIKKEEPTSRLKPIQPAPSHVAPSPAGGHHPPPPPVNVQYIIPAPLQSVYYTHAAEPPASFILQPAPAAQPQHLAPGVHHAAVPGAPGVHSAVPAPPPGVQHPMQSVGQLPLVSAVPVLAPEPLPAASSQAAPSADLGGTVREVSTRSQATSPVYHDQVSVPAAPDPPVSVAGRTGLPSQLSYQASSPVSNRLTQDHSSSAVTEHHSDVSLQTNGVDLSHHNGVLSHTSHGRSSPECPSPERASREEQVTPVQAARDDETTEQTAVETEETREETEERHLETKETPRQTVAAEEPYSIRAGVKSEVEHSPSGVNSPQRSPSGRSPSESPLDRSPAELVISERSPSDEGDLSPAEGDAAAETAETAAETAPETAATTVETAAETAAKTTVTVSRHSNGVVIEDESSQEMSETARVDVKAVTVPASTEAKVASAPPRPVKSAPESTVSVMTSLPSYVISSVASSVTSSVASSVASTVASSVTEAVNRPERLASPVLSVPLRPTPTSADPLQVLAGCAADLRPLPPVTVAVTVISPVTSSVTSAVTSAVTNSVTVSSETTGGLHLLCEAASIQRPTQVDHLATLLAAAHLLSSTAAAAPAQTSTPSLGPLSALCEVAEQHLSRVVEPRVFFVPPRWEMWKRPAVDPAGRRDYRSVQSAEIARDWLRRRAAGNGAALDQMQVRFTIEPFWEDSPRIQELHSKLADIQRLYRAQLKLHRLSPRKNSSESPAKRRPSVRGARRSAVRRRSDSTRTPPRASPPPVAAVSSRQSEEGAVSETESEDGGLDVWEDTACADTISYSFSSRRENNYSNGIRALAECKKRHVPQTSDFHLGSDPARKKRKLCPPKKHSFSPDDTETIVAKKKCYPLLKPKLKPKLKAEVIMKDSFSDGEEPPPPPPPPPPPVPTSRKRSVSKESTPSKSRSVSREAPAKRQADSREAGGSTPAKRRKSSSDAHAEKHRDLSGMGKTERSLSVGGPSYSGNGLNHSSGDRAGASTGKSTSSGGSAASPAPGVTQSAPTAAAAPTGAPSAAPQSGSTSESSGAVNGLSCSGSRDPALSAADLSETTQLLVLIDGLFYRSRLEPIQPPDLYGVTVEGERCHRPNIYTQEQLLNQAVREVRPASFSSLTPGTRVLANWSPKLRGLFPGTVTEGVSPEPGMLYVEFDDGDSGYMRLEGIRMLPANYPTVEHDQDPLDTLSRRRRRASSGTSVTSSQRAASRQSVGEDRWEPHPPTASAPAPAANGRQAEEAKDEPNVEKEGRLLSVDESTNGMDGGEAGRGSDGVKGKKGELKKRKKVDGSLKKKGDGSMLSDSKKHLEGGKSKKSAHTKDRKTEPSKKKKSEQSKKASKHEENGNHHLQNGHKKHHSHKNGDEAPKKKKKKRDSADGSSPLTAEERAEKKKKKAAKRRESAASDGYVVEQESDLKLRIKSPSPSRKQEKEETRDRHHSAEGKKKKKGESNRQRHPSGMAAFLPERQLWDWDGRGVKRSASKGKAKREVYKAIVRGAERIAVGDCAVFLSAGLPDRPYVGRIQALWETTSGQMLVQVAWFYHPEETCGLDRPLAEPKGGLFESPHMDDNDVQTISHRCQVLSLAEYRQTVSSGDNETFYRAGFYDPRCQTIRREPGV